MLAEQPPPVQRRGARKLGIALVLVCAIAAGVWVFQSFWLRPSGHLAWGYFEYEGDSPRLVTEGFDGQPWDWELILQDATRLWISPGKPVVVPIRGATDLRVTAPGADRIPYLVFGALVPSRSLSPPHHREVLTLSGARTLDIGPNGFALTGWDATRAWRSDLERLRAIARGCAPERTGPPMVHVAVQEDHLHLNYGTCRLDLPLDSTTAVVALLPGPDALLAESNWNVERDVEWNALLCVTLLACISAISIFLGLGLGLCVVFSILPLLAAAVLSPFVAILAWVATAVVGLLYCSGKLAKYVWTSHRRAGILVIGTAAILIALVWIQRASSRPDPVKPRNGTRAVAMSARRAGVLLGYSAIAGGGLRSDTDGLFEHFGRAGNDYVQLLSQRGFSGGTFPLIEAYVCDQFNDLQKGSLIFFFGGTNDDWISGLQMSRLAPLRMLLLDVQLKSDTHRYERRELLDARPSLAVLPRQEQVIMHAIQCARARENRFIFFHDFLVSDLGRDVPLARRQMRDARRRVVRAAGGEFVDLFDELQDRVGIASFNDIMHPSSVGHAHIAGYMAEYLARNPTAPVPPES